jgi:hypothetical protein
VSLRLLIPGRIHLDEAEVRAICSPAMEATRFKRPFLLASVFCDEAFVTPRGAEFITGVYTSITTRKGVARAIGVFAELLCDPGARNVRFFFKAPREKAGTYETTFQKTVDSSGSLVVWAEVMLEPRKPGIYSLLVDVDGVLAGEVPILVSFLDPARSRTMVRVPRGTAVPRANSNTAKRRPR